MFLKFFDKKKLLKFTAISVLVILLGVIILMPIVMGIVATLPQHSIVGKLDMQTEEVTLKTEDGISLKAWYKKSQNGAVIIVLHGASNSRENMKSRIQVLLSDGYGILAIDQRGHGESSGNANRLGWSGTKDLGAAVEFLKGQADVKAIGALGNSMGGEVILGAASTYPEIKAIASEGATYRDYEEFAATTKYSKTAKEFSTSRLTYWTVQIVTGTKPPKPTIVNSIKNSDAHFLFIAAGTKSQEKDYNNIFLQAAGDHGELWVVEGSKHTGAYQKEPEQYSQKLLSFFNSNLL